MVEPPFSAGIWCVVANVAPVQVHGEAHELQAGTKHFSPNTKVYCFPPQWGDGYEKIKIVGRHRGSSHLVTMVIHEKRLTNWRVQRVFQPYVVQHVPAWRSKELADLMVAAILIGREADQATQQGLDSAAPNDALIYALRLSRLDEVQSALERGADVNLVRADGWTALGMAILYGGIKGVRLLLAQGARVDTVGVYATTAVRATPSLYHNDVVLLVDRATGQR